MRYQKRWKRDAAAVLPDDAWEECDLSTPESTAPLSAFTGSWMQAGRARMLVRLRSMQRFESGAVQLLLEFEEGGMFTILTTSLKCVWLAKKQWRQKS